MKRVTRFGGLTVLLLSLFLTSCASDENFAQVTLPPPAKKLNADQLPAGAAVAVNRFLWAASLQTLQFMPLDFADPYGGLITTDWYANPSQPEERFRAIVYILDSRLRADAMRLSLFKQTYQDGRGWSDAKVSITARAEIENSILSRARELRLNSMGEN